jgi:hypothetical protein
MAVVSQGKVARSITIISRRGISKHEAFYGNVLINDLREKLTDRKIETVSYTTANREVFLKRESILEGEAVAV